MPNLNEIAEFREELKNIAQEERITSNWRERVYDELSPPDPAEVPELDIDALLPSSEPDKPHPPIEDGVSDVDRDDSFTAMTGEDVGAAYTQEDTGATFDMIPVSDSADPLPDIDAFSSFDDIFGGTESGNAAAGSDDTADFDDFLSSFDFDTASAAEPATGSETDFAQTDFPAQEDSALQDEALQDFDEMLSSLDIDSVPETSGFESGAAEFPEAESETDISAPDISDFDFSDFDTPTQTTAAAVDSEPYPAQDKETAEDDSPFDFSSFDDALSSDTADSTDAVDSAGTDEDKQTSGGASELGSDLPDFSGMEELSLFSEDRGEFDGGEIKLADEEEDAAVSDSFDDDLLDDFDDEEVSAASDTALSDDTQGFEGISGFGMPGDMSDSFFTQQDEDQSGFSLEENVLDTAIPEVTDDQFNLPDNFKDFSADSHARLFDSVIAKSTGTAADESVLTITDEEYFDFLSRLESFPLNVQLAIQDYIGNGNDTDENKMNLVRLILSKASLKKIVRRLEKILDKSIPIPHGFERKSVEEYEQEKKTFRYWFLHRFLPVAVMTAIALILVFCISVLSWQFIYKPVKSESLYKTGYTHLLNGQYEPAVEKFNKAGEYKQKKKWYFAYARAFRKKKQFTAAEKIYNRLIYDFEYDKEGSLEYADMLSTDLRNYEKAEFVLRRRLLDEHINDKDGLLALGDVYMNWADEEPEKYDAAVKIYSRLIELYGENDTFLVRMMRYFIRTDNLAEVLVLKERFLPRLSKISPADVTELSGYLLEKRYNPKPLDSEKLRMQIDDVRMLLEKAVQADGTIPEAYYNLGRFFIYNHKQDAAIENLKEAIKRFETAAPMTARRTIHFVDAQRLLGEQLVAQKKYLDAQQLYADALNIYRDYTAFKPLPKNKIIGKLYADYGDIDYFISYNFDSALDSYQNAVKELHDTPSIYYRIGYIHYQQENYQQAIEAMSIAYAEKPADKNILYGFGNVLFKRGDYYAAQASYEQLIELLDAQRQRKGRFFPNIRPDDAVFIERYMHTANNLGATLNRIAERTGDSQKNARALASFAEATRAWDALTRNPQTMIRSKSVGLAYLNIQNMVNPRSTYTAEIYTDIPMVLDNEKILEQKEDK